MDTSFSFSVRHRLVDMALSSWVLFLAMIVTLILYSMECEETWEPAFHSTMSPCVFFAPPLLLARVVKTHTNRHMYKNPSDVY